MALYGFVLFFISLYRVKSLIGDSKRFDSFFFCFSCLLCFFLLWRSGDERMFHTFWPQEDIRSFIRKKKFFFDFFCWIGSFSCCDFFF